EKAGELMNISHDGDRVTALNESGRRVKYTVRSSDKQMKSLRKRLAGGDLRASIQSQCGAYGCSTPLIDELVDISTGVEGVLGAQLSGAGLGGCIMALVKDEAVERFQDTITESFYNKNDLPPQILNCTPIAGSGVFYL
ncbi:MAG: galactokinase, partial [Gemmatimonadota bacterium]|nr:galactokinase [Gemmatimonadota bacterium]